jgi:hypothetical protein
MVNMRGLAFQVDFDGVERSGTFSFEGDDFQFTLEGSQVVDITFVTFPPPAAFSFPD